jgi:hypothetical protein
VHGTKFKRWKAMSEVARESCSDVHSFKLE